MTKKTIRKILKTKVNNWLKSIKDAEKNTIVTGGAIANLLLKEKVKDYDIYFRDKATAVAVAHYYVNEFNEKNKDLKNKLGGSAKAYVLDGETDLDHKTDGAGRHTATLRKSSALYAEFKNQGKEVSRMVAGCTPA